LKGYDKLLKNNHCFYNHGDYVLIAGVEEAGRGPVIGPMVVCGILIKEQDQEELVKIGVKDSKLLTPLKRQKIALKIKEIAEDFKLIIVQPKEIDKALESETSNLNWLSADKFAEAIKSLNPGIAYVDCPSINTVSFKEYLVKQLPKSKSKLVVEHKADKNYPVVSAASIVAKVTRDSEIDRIKKKYGIEFGSGYPADPFTKQFLQKNYNKYPIFRKTWSSWKNIARKNGQKKLSSF
jgi:ribonuclease HII